MWEFDHKEGWVPSNWCFWTVVLEKTPGTPLDCKDIKSVNPKGNQPWICIRRTNAKLQYFGPLMWRANSLEMTLMLGGIGGRRRRGRQRMRWLDDIINSVDMSWANSRRLWRTGKPDVLQSHILGFEYGSRFLFFFHNLKFLSTEVKFLYNIVLVSSYNNGVSLKYMYIPSFLNRIHLHLSRSSQLPRLSSPCYTATSH